MNESTKTKKALRGSLFALFLCIVLLIGTTFAWFTDTASTGVNKIQSGNLKVGLQYKNVDMDKYADANGAEHIFKEKTLWEPGHVEYVNLKVSNEGNLALTYKMGINIANEKEGVNVAGEKFKLSDSLEYAVVDGAKSYSKDEAGRAQAVADAKAGSKALTEAYNATGNLYPDAKKDTDHPATKDVTLIVYMPETVGNEANYDGEHQPSIDMGINLVATQVPYESDSFGTDYDANAGKTLQVNSGNIQSYLSGDQGSIEGSTLVLAAGDYGTLTIGGVTADTKGDITYTCDHDNGTKYSCTDPDEYKAHFAENIYHGSSRYSRTMSNVTLVANGDVTINGLQITSGHLYQLANPFREGYTGYYLNQNLSNFTFKGINFTGNVNINTSSADTVIDGFTFDKCSFTTNGTAKDKGQALRYYNENNNGQVKNLVVKNCSFKNCYQGVYTMKVHGISVTGCTFDTTGHNAIAVQGTNANHGAVVITNNTFKNIGDRIIRFDVVGAGTQITIKNNTATNSGDSNKEVIKATSLASGITYDISGNSWGVGTSVVNPELRDK